MISSSVDPPQISPPPPDIGMNSAPDTNKDVQTGQNVSHAPAPKSTTVAFPRVLSAAQHYPLSSFDKKALDILPALPQVGYVLSLFLATGLIPASLFAWFVRVYGSLAGAKLALAWAFQAFVLDRNQIHTGDGLDYVGTTRIVDKLFRNTPVFFFPIKAVPYISEGPDGRAAGGHRVVLTTNLAGHRNYVFGLHPHGILNLTNGLTFERGGLRLRKYGGMDDLDVRVGGLESVFNIPLNREFMLYGYGAVSVGARAMKTQLVERGRSIGIIPGGAIEALFTSFDVPEAGERTKSKRRRGSINKLRLVLADRRGFVKLAVFAQTPLVPCLGFGENALFRQVVLSPKNRERQL